MKRTGKRVLAIGLALCLALALGTIALASGSPSLSVTSPGELTAGQEVSTIELTATEATFNQDPSSTYFQLSDPAKGSLVVNGVSATAGGTTATLNVTGKPKQGELTITVQADAFQTGGQELTATVTVKAPTVTVTASGTLTQGAANGTITLTSSGSPFKTGDRTSDITIEGGGAPAVTGATSDGSENLTVTLAAPTVATPITVKIANTAFEYPPEGQVTATQTIPVNQPTGGTATAELTGTLVQGKSADGTSIKVTVTGDGYVFKRDLSNKSYFTLGGGASAGLDYTASWTGDQAVTLNLTGTPTQNGSVTVTVSKDAFQYTPSGQESILASGSINVSQPSGGSATANLTGGPLVQGKSASGMSIQITVTGDGYVFLDSLNDKSYFTLGGANTGLDYTAARTDNNIATLTLSGTPTGTGDVTVTVNQSAFKYQPAAAITASPNITVSKPKGTVAAALQDGGELTAGVDATGKQITLTAEGDGLSFVEANKDNFTLGGDTGLTISNATGSGKTVTLTLEGTPKAGGASLTITAKATAFQYEPQGSSILATQSFTIGYPQITLKADKTEILEGHEATVILTAEGGKFKTASGTGNSLFSLAGDAASGTSITAVSATEGENTATLTLAAPAQTGTLTIKVQPGAFQYAPQTEVVTSSITVKAPEATVTATSSTLTAGTAGGTIVLTAEGDDFAEAPGTGLFALGGESMGALTVSQVETSGKTATLTLTGLPAKAGTLTITIDPSAFSPAAAKSVTVSVTVKAPTATVTTDSTLTAGTAGGTIVLTAEGDDFAASPAAGLFVLSGDSAADLTVSQVKTSGKTATLTLTGTPSKAGTLIVTVGKDAFDPPAAADVPVNVTIIAPTASVTTDSTLTEGVVGGTIVLTAEGVDFAAGPAANLFTLSGESAGDMTVSKVETSGKTATLTLSGTSGKAGTLTLTVSRNAFAPAAAADVTVTVTVKAQGTLDVETETGADAPGVDLDMPQADVAAAVLTEAEQKLLAEGAKVQITLTEENADDTVSAAEKKAVETAIGDYSVGEYLNVELVKTIDGVSTAVGQTKSPLLVVFNVPKDLQAAGRVFAIARVHGGSVAVLKDLDSDAATVTVETDLFSTYAILYRDQTDATSAPTSTAAPTAAAAPDTGDDSGLALWMGLLALSAAGLILTTGALRRRSGRR